MSMQFANVWERVADTVGDEIALINGNKKSSWSSFDSKAAKIATILEEHGLKSDSKVGIYLHNSNEYLEAQYGVFKIEGVPINVNYRYKEKVSSYTVDNYEQNFGWAFNMQVVIDSNANKAALLCENESGEARGYNARYKAQSGNAAQHSNAASGRTYYCESKLWSGAVATTYSIAIKQMPDYEEALGKIKEKVKEKENGNQQQDTK